MHAPHIPRRLPHLYALVRKHGRRAVLALLAMLALLQSAPAAEPLQVTLTVHDYPPFMATNLPHGGLLTHIVSEAFKLAGVDVRFENVSSNRAITGVMMGLYDGGFGWAHAPDRDQKLLYSENSIYTFRMVFFQRRGYELAWKKLTELGKYQIGTTLGDHYSDEFSALQAANKLQVQEAASDLNNMRKLLLGRIDLFPMEEEAGRTLIAANLTPAEQLQLSYQPNPISTIPTYLVIRRTLPHARELIERFDRGYRQLSESGQLAHIIDEAHKAQLRAAPQVSETRQTP